jgi:uncharacterized RDD family membrane protein YckC
MKCPKCGFHSFDHLESCKKCGGDLTAHKTRFGLRVPFFSGKLKAAAKDCEPQTSPGAGKKAETTPGPDSPADFGYDFMDDSAGEIENPAKAALDQLLEKKTFSVGEADPEPEGWEEGGVDFPEAPPEDEPIGEPSRFAAAPEKADRFSEYDEQAGFVSAGEEEQVPEGEEEVWAEGFAEGDPEIPIKIAEVDGLPFLEAGTERSPALPTEASDSNAKDTSGPPPGMDRTGEEFPSPSLSPGGNKTWDSFFSEDDFEIPDDLPGQELPAEKAPPEEPSPEKIPPASDLKESALSSPTREEDTDLAGLFLESLEKSWGGESPPDESLFNCETMVEKFDSPREVPDEEGNLAAEPPASTTPPDPAGEVPKTSGIAAEYSSPFEPPGKDLILEFPVLTEEAGVSEVTYQALPGTLPNLQSTWKPSLGARFGASAVDLAILCLTFWLFVVAGEAAFSPGGKISLFPSAETLAALSVPYFLVIFGLFFGYFTLFHFLVGQTPGKMLFGLRVEGQQGENSLLFSQAFLRSVGGILSLLPAGVGFFSAAFDREGRGWNDRLAGSRVVRAHEEREPAGEMEEGNLGGLEDLA